MIELKGMIDVNLKISGMLDILTEAQEHLKNQDQIGALLNSQPGFLHNLEQVREYTTEAQKQVDKYNDANVLVKKFIVDDVRMKMRSLGENFSVMTFQLQAFYVQPISRVSDANMTTNNKLSDVLLQSLSNLSN